MTEEFARTAASLISALGLLLAVFQLWRAGEAKKVADREGLKAKQTEIYQRLEIESNVVFQFEATHKAILPMFKTHLAPTRPYAGLSPAAKAEAQLIARKYYEICCNLFEIAARLKKEGYVEADVFGSWVAWYFDTVCEWGFRAVWADLRDNYTADLRTKVFDSFVGDLIRDWDATQQVQRKRDLCMPIEVIEALRVDFYRHVGETFNCPTTHGWLANSRGDFPKHPQAYR